MQRNFVVVFVSFFLELESIEKLSGEMPTAQWGGGYPLAPSRLAVGNSPVGNSGGGYPNPPFFSGWK